MSLTKQAGCQEIEWHRQHDVAWRVSVFIPGRGSENLHACVGRVWGGLGRTLFPKACLSRRFR